MKKAMTQIAVGVAVVVVSGMLMGMGAFLWEHFKDTAGVRSDLDALYGLVNDVAQDE